MMLALADDGPDVRHWFSAAAFTMVGCGGSKCSLYLVCVRERGELPRNHQGWYIVNMAL